MYEGSPRELQRLNDTRWACRYLACRNVMDRLPAIKHILQEIVQEPNGERSMEARGQLAQIDVEFVAHIVTVQKIFADTKRLSDMLQSSSVDLSKAVDLVKALAQTLKEYRNESSFDDLWNEVLNIAQQCNIVVEQIPKRQQSLSSHLEGHCVLTTIGERRSQPDKCRFLTEVFCPVLDEMLNELDKRFSKENCSIMTGIQSLNPSSPSFLQEEALFLFANMNKSNIEDLGHELHQFKIIV